MSSSTTANQTNQQFRDSLPRDASQSERIAMTFAGYRVMFLETIKQVLDNYGLAQKLEIAKQQGYRLRILQLNCAEGLFLHELARLLEERGLLEGVDLYGITEDPTQIATADEYRKLSKPPRPYLNFYLHNLHQPLEQCIGLYEELKTEGHVQFDLIFGANETLISLKDAQMVVNQLYQNNVKPGGLLFFTDFIFREGPDGWLAPHPILAETTRATALLVESYNPGVEVALAMTEWLRELGAVEVLDFKTKIEWGGLTEIGRSFLYTNLLFVKTIGPEFVKAGLLQQAQYDKFIWVMYHELTQQHIGQMTFNTMIARKLLT
jgi:hypothetical protein